MNFEAKLKCPIEIKLQKSSYPKPLCLEINRELKIDAYDKGIDICTNWDGGGMPLGVTQVAKNM